MFVEEFKDEEIIEEFLKIFDINEKTKKNGSPYKSVVIGDKTGTVVWNVWDNLDEFDEIGLKIGDILFVEGQISYWNNIAQINISNVRKKNEDDVVDASKFVNSINLDQLEDYKQRLKNLIEQLDEPWKKVIIEVFSNEKIKEQFFISPASISFHENYLGGLVEHTVSLVEQCVSRVKTGNLKYINKNLLISIGLLHNIGKIKQYNSESLVYTNEGYFKGHIYMSAHFVEKILEKSSCELNENEKNLLISGILSSHGKPEWGSPVSPLSKESWIIAQEDYILSRLANWDFEIENKKNSAKDFIYSKLLQQHAFIGKTDK